MIQKKLCMVGLFATGKTSLVRQFVDTIFSERYLSTVGVKIDRKAVKVDGTQVNLLLWDLEGERDRESFRTSYLRGAAGILYVVDGTRRDTLDRLFSLRSQVEREVGELPSIVALNKHDLLQDWELGETDYDRLRALDWEFFWTSAKTGKRVEQAFHWLAIEMLRVRPKKRIRRPS